MTARRRAAALLVVPVLAACGLKSAPVAPELVRPLPPTKVAATVVRGGVEVRWRRPTQYTGGGRMRDLRGFDVERAATPVGPFAPAGTVRLDDQQRFRQARELTWIDRSVVPGAAYAYRVTAVTVDGSRSVPSTTAVIRYDPPPKAPPSVDAP